MGLLTGKTGLVVGVANDRSIAWGSPGRFTPRRGSRIHVSVPAIEERVRPLTTSLSSPLRRTVRRDPGRRHRRSLRQGPRGLRSSGHPGPRRRVRQQGRSQGTVRLNVAGGIQDRLDVSAYSRCPPWLAGQPPHDGRNGSIVTMTYYGAEKVMPGYNVMESPRPLWKLP